MKSNSSASRWKVYEQEVFDLFKRYFPAANIQKNVKIKGRFSKRRRQIDILITENTPAGTIRAVIDTKSFKRKIDVKAVDAFTGFVDDVEAQKGMMITERGFTKAALRRAFYGPADLELDIVSFSSLQRFQTFVAVPYVGDKAFLITAPFGWIIEIGPRNGWLACMYQRGLDAETARKNKEFLYVNFWDRKKDPLTAAELDECQVARMRVSGPVDVSHRPTILRSDATTRLRIADVKRRKCLEVTGFLEFEDVIFFAVLNTPAETQRPNIRRLESVLQRAIRVNLRRDNTALISGIREQLKQTSSPPERARLLRQAGHWYRDMAQWAEAKEQLEQSLTIEPGVEQLYATLLELLPILRKLDERQRALELFGRLLRLDPHNPSVFSDCLTFSSGWIEGESLLKVIDALRAEQSQDPLTRANCDFYSGNLFLSLCDIESARQRFTSAQVTFRQHLPRRHEVFRTLRTALRICTECAGMHSVQTESSEMAFASNDSHGRDRPNNGTGISDG